MTPSLLFAVLLLSVSVTAQQRSVMGQRPRTPTIRIPVVVELFTSEGCSSCPPADVLLARLSEQRGLPRGVEIIALSEHVDYWDSLGWKDRFSSPLFSTRQQDYGIAFHSSNVYTPQAVVNGQKEVLGSDQKALVQAVTNAAQQASSTPPTTVEIRLTLPDTLHLLVSKLPPDSHQADVLLAIAEGNLETDVRTGENGGRRLRHVAVVRTMSKLAELDPSHPGEYTAEARLNLRPDWNRANITVVLLVQDRQTRRILAANSVKMR